MGELQLYQYDELPTGDSIRIIALAPGQGDQAIRCTLKVVNHNNIVGQYECISYVWGDPAIVVDIICDGKRLPVTKSLRDALQRFRHTDKERILWADAICIHQGNPTEKGLQVRKMGVIYQEAKDVLGWIGADVDGIGHRCFELVEDATRQIAERWDTEISTVDALYKLKLSGSDNVEDWSKFKRLLERPWFGRLWVTQESGLARECTVYWGEAYIDFWKIIEVASYATYSSNAPKLPGTDGKYGQVLIDMFDIHLTYDNKITWRNNGPICRGWKAYYPVEKQLWVDVLFSARTLQVSDKRDVVYASLGSPLSNKPDGELIIEPDYKMETPPMHVKLAGALMNVPREAPQVLLRVFHGAPSDLENEAVPSWVPRWLPLAKDARNPIPLSWSYEYRTKPYRAGRGGLDFSAVVEPGNILHIKTLRFDTITYTSFPLDTGDLRGNIDSWAPRFRDGKISAIETIWKELLAHTHTPPDDLVSDFSLTLARGRPQTETPLNDFLAYCEHLRTIAGTADTSPFPPPDPVNGEGHASNAEMAVLRCRDKRVAYTRGRLAIVPFVAAVGDVCCVVEGMDVPIIMRRTKRETWKLVGEAFVMGVMEGELMREGSGEGTWEDVRIE